MRLDIPRFRAHFEDTQSEGSAEPHQPNPNHCPQRAKALPEGVQAVPLACSGEDTQQQTARQLGIQSTTIPASVS